MQGFKSVDSNVVAGWWILAKKYANMALFNYCLEFKFIFAHTPFFEVLCPYSEFIQNMSGALSKFISKWKNWMVS